MSCPNTDNLRGNERENPIVSGMVLKPPYFNMNWSLNDIDVDINWIGAYQKKIK